MIREWISAVADRPSMIHGVGYACNAGSLTPCAERVKGQVPGAQALPLGGVVGPLRHQVTLRPRYWIGQPLHVERMRAHSTASS